MTARGRVWFGVRPHRLVGALLLAWAASLVVAGVRLHAWQSEMAQVLMQLRADNLLRSAVTQRDQVRPDWYRHRATALLSTVERLRENALWAIVMPGSWDVFDNLEQRASAQIDRAFAQTVVETIRGELETRAARLTGAPLRADSAQLGNPVQCAAAPAGAAAALPLKGTDLPEYVALNRQLQELAGLDRAVGTLLALRQPAKADPDDLRRLVRFSLGAELSGSTSRSLVLFHSGQSDAQAQALVERLQATARCSVALSIAALHQRWLADNEILQIEDTLARIPPAALLEPAAGDFARSQTRLRQSLLLMARQEALLTQAAQDWMAGPEHLGPEYGNLVQQVAAIRLLGPPMAERMGADAQAAHARFRTRLHAFLARADRGFVRDKDGRLAVSPQRIAWRKGLAGLLEQPFMSADPLPTPIRAASWTPPANFDELALLPEQRRRFAREVLPLFPASQRTLVMRYVDDRLVQRAFENVGPQLVPADGTVAPSDTAVIQAAVAGLAAAESTLASIPNLAAGLRSRVEREVLVPLAMAAGQPAMGSTVMGAPPAFNPARTD